MWNILNTSSNVATEFDKMLYLIYNIICLLDRYRGNKSTQQFFIIIVIEILEGVGE
jgi:hypothetical protein